MPVVSRDIKSHEGSILLEFELRKGRDVAAEVLTPQGQPAAGAQVALGITGAQIMIRNGAFREVSTYCERQTANESGEFRFPPQKEDFRLVVTHPSGFANVGVESDNPPRVVQLQAWAKVAGTYQIGTRAAENVELEINLHDDTQFREDGPRIHYAHDTRTTEDGRFVFNRVIPGQGRIGRSITVMVNTGPTEVTSTSLQAVNLPAGETVHFDLGGTGRPVAGKLQMPERFEGRYDWRLAMVHVNVDMQQPPPVPFPAAIAFDPEVRSAWFKQWKETPAGKAFATKWEDYEQRRFASPIYRASAEHDGSFRIDDMLDGEYKLDVWFTGENHQNVNGHISYGFTVPSIPGGRSAEVLDLGTITLP